MLQNAKTSRKRKYQAEEEEEIIGGETILEKPIKKKKFSVDDNLEKKLTDFSFVKLNKVLLKNAVPVYLENPDEMKSLFTEKKNGHFL